MRRQRRSSGPRPALRTLRHVAVLRRGLWIYPGCPAGELVDAIVAADELGLDEVWLADEGVAREPFAVLAAAARATRRITLAVGITSPLLRHPGAIAATAATLDELSHGRALVGLGVGGHESLAPFGLATDRPVGVLRDAISLIRAVFASTPAPGYEPPAHAMAARASIPIWIGARGPQLTALAARDADGLFLSGCSHAQHDEIIPRVRAIAPIAVALYQSASDRMSAPSVYRWDDVGGLLADDVARHYPTSVGINLVDPSLGGPCDLVALVERAAAALGPLSNLS
jgi:alkanesulfonate monooxygenase SsuD/methylene tetrahydromethanopterin reductase-like flavin-dependent oxidoreductase (luciferase family)